MTNEGAVTKAAKSEVVVPDRPALRGTVAERLAKMRAEAAFALWAVAFGAGPAQVAWDACPRADWLLDTVALSSAYQPGSAAHRLVVLALLMGAREVLHRQAVADAGERGSGRLDAGGSARIAVRADGHELLDVVEQWSREAEPSPLLARRIHELSQRFSPHVGEGMRGVVRSAGAGGDAEQTALRQFGAGAACFFAAATVFDPRAAATAAMTISLLESGELVCPKYCEFVRGLFPHPPAEMEPEAPAAVVGGA